MSDKTAKDLLTDFGLTKKEAEIYLFLAKYEALTGGEIAKQTRIARSLVYRILKSLQSKGLVEPTLEAPIRFTALSLEKTIDLIIKTKQEEAFQVQRLKNSLLEDWKTVTQSKPKLSYEKFVVIENSKKIYSKVLQMIMTTKKQFVGLLTISTLARGEQFGIFERSHNRLLNFGIPYQFVTNITHEDIEDLKKINSRLFSGIKLNVITSKAESKAFPRFFIRDDEEILFFIRPESEFSLDEQHQVCILTNCSSLLQTFKNIFQDKLKKSMEINEAIQRSVAGKIPKHGFERNESDFVTSASYENQESSITEIDQVDGLVESLPKERLQKLKEDEEDILELISIAGDEFSFATIENVGKYNRVKLLKNLDALERKHRLIRSTATGYRFNQQGVRKFLLNKISPKLKKEYHSLFADFFQKEGFSEENLKHLGHHLAESGRTKEAINPFLKAGSYAEAKWNIFEAIKLFSQAIELMENNEQWTNEKSKIFEHLGELHGLCDDYKKANTCFRKGIETSKDKLHKERIRKKICTKVSVKKGKTTLSYFRYGRGRTTIVFIGISFHFIPQIYHFSKEYDIAFIDLLKLFEPKNSPSEHSVKSYIECIQTIIDHLENSTVFLVGVGLGGALSINFVSNYPGKISKLSLIATHLKQVKSEDEQYKEKIDGFWVDALQDPSWGWKKITEKITPSQFEWEKNLIPVSYDILKLRRRIPELSSVIMAKLLMEMDLEPLLKEIDIPTLILHGEMDPLSIEDLKKMNEKIPNSRLHIFKDAIFITIYEADKFNKELENFFKN